MLGLGPDTHVRAGEQRRARLVAWQKGNTPFPIKLRRRALDPCGKVGSGDDHRSGARNETLGLVEIRSRGYQFVLVEADVEIGSGLELGRVEGDLAVLQHVSAGLPRELDRQRAVPLRDVVPVLAFAALSKRGGVVVELSPCRGRRGDP